MPVILVVDDSKVDQKLIGHLIEKEDIDWIVEFANSAEEALVRLQALAVDILVTDMRMPGMDGLALLNLVRARYKNLPVVVVTGQGSEELAADALRQGAASYVPKTELVTRLNETIKQVLEINSTRRSYDSLLQHVKAVRVQLDLGNQIELVGSIVSSVQQLLEGLKICGQEGQRRVGVAMDEAILNSICHGNLNMSPEEMREIRTGLRDSASCKLLESRRADAKFAKRNVSIELDISPEAATISVTDEGAGFDPTPLLSGGTVESLEENRTRGLVLIRTLMDRVEFNENGTRLTMTKFRESPNDAESTIPVD